MNMSIKTLSSNALTSSDKCVVPLPKTNNLVVPVVSRRSCEFTNNIGLCIGKATLTLDKLQNGLEQWRKNKVLENLIGKGKNEPAPGKLPRNKRISNQKPKLAAICSGATLECYSPDQQLDGASCRDLAAPDADFFEDDSCQIYKEMVSKVQELVVRLEKDRSAVEALLEKERNRTKTLHKKIDEHALRRILELPKAVQEEHEKCAYDVQELKWHCSYEGRIEARTREKVKRTEILNNKIKEEIAFVKENCPLIEGKLEIEKDAMIIIDEKQAQTDAELKKAVNTLKVVQHDFSQLKKKAECKQKLLAEKLLNLSNKMKVSLENLLKQQQEYSRMCETANLCETETELNLEIIKELGGKLVKIQEIEDILESELNKLKKKIEFQMSECKRLLKKNENLENGRANQEKALEKMREDNKKENEAKWEGLKNLLQGTKIAARDIANIKKEHEKCEKQKESDIKSGKRAVMEKEQVNADYQIVKQEAHELRLTNEKLLLMLDQEKSKAEDVEKNLKITLESIQKQLKDESHAKTILQLKINLEEKDLQNKKKDAEKKRDKITKTNEEVQRVVSTVSSQVEKICQKYEERVKIVDGLNSLIKQVDDKLKETKSSLTKEVGTLEPQEKSLKDQQSNIKQKHDKLESTTIQYEKRLRDMAASSIMMNKQLIANQKAIDELNEEIVELKIRLDTGQKLESSLKTSLEEVQERSKSNESAHTIQVQCRNQTLEKTKKCLNEALEENKKLAIQYVEQQAKHINEKNAFITTYEKSILAQENLKDKENLCDLHARLHEAMKCYYRLRGLQTKNGLLRFHEISQNSNSRLENIRKALETSVKNITLFLQASNNTHQLIQLEKILPIMEVEIPI